MNMTPIKVRGARKRNQQPGAPPLPSRKCARKPGRSQPESDAIATSIRSQRSATRLSSLESLPAEILQTILVHCANIALTDASGEIGVKLSTDSMYRKVSIELLSFEAEDHEGHHSKHDSPYDPRQIQRLLNSRWMTWPKFKGIISSIQSGADLNFDHPEQQESNEDRHLTSKVMLPNKLLAGPWSRDRSQFLYYLCWQGLGVDFDQSLAGEVASAGLLDAIENGKEIVVASLLSESVHIPPTQQMLRSAIMTSRSNRTIVLHVLSASVRMHARARLDRAVQSADQINFLDTSIWSWINRVARVKPDHASWLKEAMRTAQSLTLDSSRSMRQLHGDLASVAGREADGVNHIPLPWADDNAR